MVYDSCCAATRSLDEDAFKWHTRSKKYVDNLNLKEPQGGVMAAPEFSDENPWFKDEDLPQIPEGLLGRGDFCFHLPRWNALGVPYSDLTINKLLLVPKVLDGSCGWLKVEWERLNFGIFVIQGGVLMLRPPILGGHLRFLLSANEIPCVRFLCFVTVFQCLQEIQQGVKGNLEWSESKLNQLRPGSGKSLNIPRSLEALGNILQPLFPIQEELVRKLTPLAGKTGVDQEIVRAAKEAFALLVPYLVADDLGRQHVGI